MDELFKTTLILSLIGFSLTLVLLCIKPLTTKKFPARWQKTIWIIVLFCMLVPFYKLIPDSAVQYMNIPEGQEIINFDFVPVAEDAVQDNDDFSVEVVKENEKPSFSDVFSSVMRFLPYIWLVGVFAFLSVAFSSYIIYLLRKRKNRTSVQNEVFENVKSGLRIRRKIPLFYTDDVTSPVLVGVLFPKVYIPKKQLGDDGARMVFLHELIHYKRGDLILKWLSLFVNAIHWFNPVCYILCRNISVSARFRVMWR